MKKITITVDSGTTHPDRAGRVVEMNNFSYPNRLINVLNGKGNAGNLKLPFKCSDINLREEYVFTWSQNAPGNEREEMLTNMNWKNMQIGTPTYVTNSTICDNGVGL